jgi:hypothetical protein
MNRRNFFKESFNILKDTARDCLKEFFTLKKELEDIYDEFEIESDEDFIESYEKSYALTLAYPRDFFEQIAKKAGISYEEKETLDLVSDLLKNKLI